MVKVIRVAIIAVILHALVITNVNAKEANCRSALERCITQCEGYPGIFSDVCNASCVLGYLTCD